MSKPDGGPAFPQDYETGNMQDWKHGMTLRDYFAGQALAGLVSQDVVTNGPAGPDFIAPMAYEYADAMLAEREK